MRRLHALRALVGLRSGPGAMRTRQGAGLFALWFLGRCGGRFTHCPGLRSKSFVFAVRASQPALPDCQDQPYRSLPRQRYDHFRESHPG